VLENVSKGSLMMQIPSWLAFSIANPRIGGSDTPLGFLTDSNSIYHTSGASTQASPRHSRLAIALLFERFRGGSFFQPYICMLDEVVDTPLFWDDQKLKAVESKRTYDVCAKVMFTTLFNVTTVLPAATMFVPDAEQVPTSIAPGNRLEAYYKQYSIRYNVTVLAVFKCSPELLGLRNVIQRWRKDLTESFSLYVPALELQYPKLFPPGALSMENWAWANYHVRSRCWGKGKESVMNPFLDMFNHRYSANHASIHNVAPNNETSALKAARAIHKGGDGDNTVMESEKNLLEGSFFKAERDYGIGDEIHLSYGGHSCNMKWLAYYGFTVPQSDCYCDYSSVTSPEVTKVEQTPIGCSSWSQ